MTDEEKQIEDEAWERLYQFANSCIFFGESDIDRERFAQGRESFQIILKTDE